MKTTTTTTLSFIQRKATAKIRVSNSESIKREKKPISVVFFVATVLSAHSKLSLNLLLILNIYIIWHIYSLAIFGISCGNWKSIVVIVHSSTVALQCKHFQLDIVIQKLPLILHFFFIWISLK